MPKGDIAIKAGALRHLCNILQPAPGPPGVSGNTTNFIPFAQYVQCAIEPVSARDTIRGGQTISETIIPITMRWMPSLLPTFVIEEIESTQGTYSVIDKYIVQGIIDVDRRHWRMTLACLALVNNY